MGFIDDQIEFDTFLIASHPSSNIYDFLGGFSWSARVEDDGFTDIISLETDAEFTVDYAQQILDDFGYTRVPIFGGYNGYYTDIFDGAFSGVLDDTLGTWLSGGIGFPAPGYVPNDDSSGGPYLLGFSLNYFGNSYDSFYINNNGNISFTNKVNAYTPEPLNTTNVAPMIAPYWADVDTRGTGTVALRTDIPNQVIVTWDKVGYYSQHTDKRASFQLVLRGPDYSVPEDEGNIGFFYKDIQWETGDASSGVGGFGGTQATIGFGDGIASFNSGEFSLAGSQQAGISQLVSNQYFWFNLNSEAGGTIEGSSQENPILPDSITQIGAFIFNNVFSGAWVDPPTAYGFEYSMISPGSLFTQILDFPIGLDADNLFTVSVGETNLGAFAPGSSVDFVSLLGAGVPQFTITGIDPLVDPSNPTAFPLQLAFNTPTASFQMQALQSPTSTSVPEPSSIFGIFALSSFGVGSRLLRKQQER